MADPGADAVSVARSGNRDDSDSSSDDEATRCVICLEAWTTRGRHRIVSLKCGHLFGRHCIERWLDNRKRCPSCKKRARKADIRPIFVAKMAVVDNSEREHAIEMMNKMKRKEKERLQELGRFRLEAQMLRQELQQARETIQAQAHRLSILEGQMAGSSTRAPLPASLRGPAPPSTGNSGTADADTNTLGEAEVRLWVLGSVDLAADARCCDLSPSGDLVVVGCADPSGASNAWGVMRQSLCDFTHRDFLRVHTKTVRDIRHAPVYDTRSGAPGLVLSASMDRSLVVTSMASGMAVATYALPGQGWACAWHPTDPNVVFCGLHTGHVVAYDLRQREQPIASVALPGGKRQPVHSVAAFLLPCDDATADPDCCLVAGTISAGLHVWRCERTPGASSTQVTPLELGPPCSHVIAGTQCTSVCVDPASGRVLASFRPSAAIATAFHSVLHLVGGELRWVADKTVAGLSGQRLMARSTLALDAQGHAGSNGRPNASPDGTPSGRLLVVAPDDASRAPVVWDAGSGEMLQSLLAHPEPLVACASRPSLPPHQPLQLATLSKRRLVVYEGGEPPSDS